MDTVTKEAKLLAVMLETGRKALLANVSLFTSEGDINFNDVAFVHSSGDQYRLYELLTLPPCERAYSVKEMRIVLTSGYSCTDPINLTAHCGDSIDISLHVERALRMHL